MLNNGLYFISRMKYPTSKGYYVRIYTIGGKLIALKFFSFGRWKCWCIALVEAIQWRDEFIQKLNPKVRLANGKNPPFRTRLSKKNRSGVTGVYYAKNPIRGVAHPCWVASWCEAPKKPRVKKFSIRRYGSKMAKRLATRYRKERVSELKTLNNH